MPRISHIQTNFTAGEISPRLLGRIDVARYANAVKRMENMYVLVHGGARRRPGTRFMGEVKDSSKLGRLIPFIFSRTQAFMLEFGDLYVRFYTPSGRILSGGVPYEIASPYGQLDLEDIHYAGQADTLLLAHPSYAIRSLVRYGNTSWKLSAKSFVVPASEERGDRPNATLTLSGTTGAVTATASAASFQNADVGRQIEIGSGLLTITGFTSTTQVSGTVVDAFASTGPHAAGTWTITESPKTTLTPSAKDPIGASVTLTAGANAFKNDAQVNHVGAYVEINDGLIEITGFTNASTVTGIIRSALSATAAAPSGGWALRTSIWNATDGYPRAISIYEQRLVVGGSPGYPNRIDLSKTGEFFNFADGIADSDGFSYAIGGEYNAIEHLPTLRGVLPLTFGGGWLLTGGIEKPLTPTNPQLKDQTAYGAANVRPVRVGNEIIYIQRGYRRVRALGWRIDEDAYKAADISILSEHITRSGIYEMAYSQERDPVVWMVRGDGVLVSMSIDRDQDVIGFARQITDGQVESVAVIPDDDVDQVWLLVKRTINGVTKRYVEVLEDGLNTDSCITGAVPSKAIVSATWANGVATFEVTGHGYTTGDEVKVKDVEPAAYNARFEITVTDANHFTAPLPLDASPGSATAFGIVLRGKTTAWSGLSHLEGKTVDVVADGVVQPQRTVSGGAVTLADAAFEVEIGLHYDSEVELLPPPVGTGQGTAHGNAMSTHEVIIRVHETIGGRINGAPIPYRKFGANVLNKAIQPYTGDLRLSNLGWTKGGETITITQDQPLPMQLLSVIRRMTVND